MRFNLNQNVLVRVTPIGRKRWDGFWKEGGGRGRELPVDGEGYTKLQLHEVMLVFGPDMIGNPTPIDSNVELVLSED